MKHLCAIQTHTAKRRGPVGSRAGFTLIELLVAVTIFLILATVTLTAVGAFQTADRVSGSARQVQSYISGARDRAIYTTRTEAGARSRGVRLLINTDLLDANGDPFACTTLQYVERAGYFPPPNIAKSDFPSDYLLFLAGGPSDGTVPELLPPFRGAPFGDANGDFLVEEVNSDGDEERVPPSEKRNGLTTVWRNSPLNRVFQAGLLGEHIAEDLYTARVRLPKDPDGVGRWYQALIRSAGAPDATEQTQRIAGIARVFLMTFSPAENLQSFNLNATEEGYMFELRTVPLAGEDPRTLPNNTAIDLRGSAMAGGLPQSWLDPTKSNVPLGPLDIMFDPAGLVTGPLAASGLVHLPVVSLDDLDQGSNRYDASADPPGYVPGAFLPLGYVGTDPDAPIAFDGTTYSGPGKSAADLIVTVNTQTGNVTVSPVDGTVGTADGLADDPLQYAETGLEAP